MTPHSLSSKLRADLEEQNMNDAQTKCIETYVEKVLIPQLVRHFKTVQPSVAAKPEPALVERPTRRPLGRRHW